MDVDVDSLIESPLRRKLAAMPEAERQSQEALLKKMSVLELMSMNKNAHEEEQQQEKEQDADRPKTPEVDPFKGMVVLSPLRRRTMATASNPEELAFEIRQLRRLSPYELVRENNIAKHKEVLKSLGLDKSFSELMGIKKGAAPGGGKRKKTGGGGRGRKAKRAREDRGDEDEQSGSGEEEDEEEEEEEEEETSAPPARAPRAQCTKAAPARAAPKEWVVKAKNLLEDESLGEAWAQLVRLWYLREEGKGFVAPVRVEGVRLKEK
jgi:hypothetical protein